MTDRILHSSDSGHKPVCRVYLAVLVLSVFVFAALVFASAAFSIAATGKASSENESGSSVTSDDVRHWVGELGSDDFGTREEATVRLAKAGFVAIQPVAAAAMTDDLEVACRSVEVLRQLLNLEDLATSDAAADALTKIAESPSGSAADLAADVLGDFQESRQSRAVDELRRLGAVVEIGPIFPGGAIVRDTSDGICVTLGADWHGKHAEFRLLKWMPDLVRLNVHAAPITDDDLLQLRGLDRLEMVDLFGSKVSAAGAARFAAMYPGAKIDRRSSAMLGVAGALGALGCGITRVESNTPAEKAGIVAGDIVVRFEGQPVPDFETLTTMIGSRNPGDKVTIELRRGSDLLKKEVELGAWK